MIQFHIGLPTCTHRRLQATTSVIADLPACPNEPSTSSMLLELARQWLDAKNHPSSMHAAAQLLMLRRLPCHCAHPLTLLQYIYTSIYDAKQSKAQCLKKPEFLQSTQDLLGNLPLKNLLNWQPLSNLVTTSATPVI